MSLPSFSFLFGFVFPCVFSIPFYRAYLCPLFISSLLALIVLALACLLAALFLSSLCALV